MPFFNKMETTAKEKTQYQTNGKKVPVARHYMFFIVFGYIHKLQVLLGHFTTVRINRYAIKTSV